MNSKIVRYVVFWELSLEQHATIRCPRNESPSEGFSESGGKNNLTHVKFHDDSDLVNLAGAACVCEIRLVLYIKSL